MLFASRPRRSHARTPKRSARVEKTEATLELMLVTVTGYKRLGGSVLSVDTGKLRRDLFEPAHM